MKILASKIALVIISTLAMASAQEIQSIQAKNVEIHLGQGTSQTATLQEFSLQTKTTHLSLYNQTMDATWQNDHIYLKNSMYEGWLPFIEQTPKNEFNQYYISEMDLSYEAQKHFQISFDHAKFQMGDTHFLLDDFYLNCQKKFNTKASSTLEVCLTDQTTGGTSYIKMDPVSNAHFRNFFYIESLMKNYSFQIMSSKDIRDSTLSIWKNQFELETEYEGKSISISGTIHYDPTHSHLNIYVADAEYFIFSVRDRIYKKIRAVKSSYLSVDRNDVITIKLEQF